MAIQWFPGHMNRAKKDIKNLVGDIDVVVELLDARAPFSSCNPLLQSLIKHKKKIRLLNKSDLADPQITKLWLDFFTTEKNTLAITGCKDSTKQRNQLMKLCQSLAPQRNSFEKPLRVMIIGIPNVGKSTLINQLVGKKSAKTGDIPAVTKANQCLVLNDAFLFYDTPGMMWQKIDYPQVGYHLALCNSIGRNACDEELIALYLLGYVKTHADYAPHLAARYKLELLAANPLDNMELLLAIGKKRGCMLPGGIIDIQKTSEAIIQDFRSAKIGKISLETPALWQQWIHEAAAEVELK
jgi:ribosome biogenesis GTPase A